MKPVVAVVGASGAVGQEMLAVLEQRRLPMAELRLFGSARSAGATVRCLGREHTIAELGERSLDGVDVALFSAGATVSRRFAPPAAAAGTLVVDNSSAFRMEPGVPLIVPEVNGDRLPALARGRGAILPVANCSAIILVMGLTALRRAFGLRRIVVATYQAASGAGA
ncbi:MAG: aspartate-semialdehyde dehydrogenase, partial [Phycisphaerae bacterium]|nr:aspartate-semialdehyde dehydrogenase [Phycisphaerae bacterium]